MQNPKGALKLKGKPDAFGNLRDKRVGWLLSFSFSFEFEFVDFSVLLI